MALGCVIVHPVARHKVRGDIYAVLELSIMSMSQCHALDKGAYLRDIFIHHVVHMKFTKFFGSHLKKE